MNKIINDESKNSMEDAQKAVFAQYQEGTRQTVLVDPKSGPYYTLEEAIEKVDSFTTIYLAEGSYTCKIAITKPGLVIEKKDKEKDVFIVGCNGPVCKIELEEHHFVVFKKIVFLHTGLNLNLKFKESAPN